METSKPVQKLRLQEITIQGSDRDGRKRQTGYSAKRSFRNGVVKLIAHEATNSAKVRWVKILPRKNMQGYILLFAHAQYETLNGEFRQGWSALLIEWEVTEIWPRKAGGQPVRYSFSHAGKRSWCNYEIGSALSSTAPELMLTMNLKWK
ncbi:hypothetical protein R6Q59_010059 [Mikania micrantha]